MVRFLGRVKHIEMIKNAFDKTRAEVEFKAGTYNKGKINEIWCLPFMNKSLVRVSTGTNNYSLLRTRNRFSKRLLDLPENTNKVLLWRQIKRSGARALHLLKNSNNNNMKSATVYFEKQEDMINSLKFLMSYYDKKLKWANNEKQEVAPTRIKKMQDEEEHEIYKESLSKEKEIFNSEEQMKENQWKSAFTERKRKEI